MRPEGPRRCPDRGNAGGALVFLGTFYTIHSVPTVNYVTTSTIVGFNLKVTKSITFFSRPLPKAGRELQTELNTMMDD